jgi:hypothetical protein
MTETKDSLTNLINASGFLFQLKLEEEIKKSQPVSPMGEWRQMVREHKWIDSLDGKEGFIDIVLESGDTTRLVIECKRATDASWLFLVPSEESETRHGQFLWTESKDNISDWHDFNLDPPSLESAFCVVRGQGEKDTPLLERLSSLLLRSTESLANEELKITFGQEQKIRLYLPTIVTNAVLYACRINISDVDISTGKLSESDFNEVPFIRFRKNLSSTIKSDTTFTSNLNEINRQNERTILIINAKELTTILKTLDIPYSRNAPWPWA